MKKKREPSLRFEYFYFDPNLFYDFTRSESSNREHLLEHQLGSNLSGYYRKEFQKGKKEAIFEYAKESRVCLQSQWVTDQIEKWRIENTIESRKKLKRLFREYLGEERGKTSWGDLTNLIKTDQRIFYEIEKLKKKSPRIPLSDIYKIVRRRIEDFGEYFAVDTIELVYKKYKKVADDFTGRGRIYAQVIGSWKKVLMRKGRGGGRFKDEMEFIKYFMGTSLDDILKRSRALSFSLDYRCSRCQDRIVLKSERKSED